ncbi:thioredoxin family protein [Bacillus sp. 2205SS5-2]|uniref:thioredoxin family protein n=1 Tax=Bacillus sp. 2205SS5-2 TaxID=3109031 RepID=UPI003005E3E4
MKKALILFGVVIVLFIGIALLNSYQQSKASEGNMFQKNSLEQDTIKLLDDPNYQNVILPSELKSKLTDGEETTVYFYSSSCSHCLATTPIVAPLAEDLGIDLVQYNLLEFEQGWNEYNIEYTPTIVQYVDGKEVARIVGGQPEVAFEQFFDEEVLN